ncbi:MAG: ATP-dependent DNA helicase RecQ [Synergistaceae bacterium]|nr:ATP-dependent DNA helicase RecQ [Synergistaceae bacterium]
MEITVYKGFDVDYLSSLDTPPLAERDIRKKLDVLSFNPDTSRALEIALLSMKEGDRAWMTYEEYTLIKVSVDNAVKKYRLKVEIVRNNLYPDYYPLPFSMPDSLVGEIQECFDGEADDEASEEAVKFTSVYSSLVTVDGVYYGNFYNFEYERDSGVLVRDYYPDELPVEEGQTSGEVNIFLNEDVETYLRDLSRIGRENPRTIGVSATEGLTSQRLKRSLQAYCLANHIRLVAFREVLEEDAALENELFEIAKKDLRIKGFESFRAIKFYRNPDVNKDVIEISQAAVIQEIIRQAERAYGEGQRAGAFRDIFITASTGAGKSLIFLIPAVYLAKKYHKLTIVIEPVKALMQDQKEKLNQGGFERVEVFNSDLITQLEKEAALKRIQSGEVDLLYLSPETLLSYSLETIIGDREVGLMIVDEAHIVTTWGVGFRPDYWYLGTYINKLRNPPKVWRNVGRSPLRFPLCAFTATAVNGGEDDSVSDTVTSLYMENPIKYLGFVRRDDIGFEIARHDGEKKLPVSKYEEEKTKVLDARIRGWLQNGTKAIVYFPYATMVGDAAKGIRAFADLSHDPRIGTYTGRNVDHMGTEAFNALKKETFDKFRKGDTLVMYATKAFGMGIDVDDIEVIYHYAATGNLCDYVQEIGRAARKKRLRGLAVTDYYENDLRYMRQLFGMSRIRRYQIQKVLQGVYDAYESKQRKRNLLISPQSFTYIFGGGDEKQCVNKLKTCLMMLEKDFYDKYGIKVLIARPRSVFTKAFVVIAREHEQEVLGSKYGECFTFVQKGRYQERQLNNALLSDTGDIYALDMKKVWEDFHQTLSFPQFKRCFFTFFRPTRPARYRYPSQDEVVVMPEIRRFFAPRQRVAVESKGGLPLSGLLDKILEDFDTIADTLYATYNKEYFTLNKFSALISEKYGQTKARLIAGSLFDLVDPAGRCVKRRLTSLQAEYLLSNGTFKTLMRKPLTTSNVVRNLSETPGKTYTGYLSLESDDNSNTALKLLSVFDYITYEVIGGEEPEIFIRLNDPNKVRDIVLGHLPYSNDYVTRAQQKHDRDVNVLRRFFKSVKSDKERWDTIEDYFLGRDILRGESPESQDEPTDED